MTAAPVVGARLARAEDVAEIANLYRRCASDLVGERGGAVAVASEVFAEPLEERILRMSAAADCSVVAGTIDDAVVGVGAARLRPQADGTVLAGVEVLYVDPEARSVGVGESILDEIDAWATAQGCSGVDAPALPGMRTSKNFFEGAGLVARLLVMHRGLQGAPAEVSGFRRATTRPPQDTSRPECCVGAVVLVEDRLLLVRRGAEPGRGKWSLPGGRVETGETLAEAVVRETLEETSLEVAPVAFLGHVERVGPGYHFVILDYLAEPVMSGLPVPTAGTDADEVAWVPLADLGGLTLVDGLADFLRSHSVLPG